MPSLYLSSTEATILLTFNSLLLVKHWWRTERDPQILLGGGSGVGMAYYGKFDLQGRSDGSVVGPGD